MILFGRLLFLPPLAIALWGAFRWKRLSAFQRRLCFWMAFDALIGSCSTAGSIYKWNNRWLDWGASPIDAWFCLWTFETVDPPLRWAWKWFAALAALLLLIPGINGFQSITQLGLFAIIGARLIPTVVVPNPFHRPFFWLSLGALAIYGSSSLLHALAPVFDQIGMTRFELLKLWTLRNAAQLAGYAFFAKALACSPG